MFKTFMCGDLSALKKTEMQIFHWFSFSNFPLVWLSPSPILGSISTFKTFMHGHLFMVTFLPHESPMCSFTLPDIYPISPIPSLYLHQRQNPVFSESSIVVIIPADCGQSVNLNHRLNAPPAVPQVSGRVIQASVWIPRSIHWFKNISVLTAELILKCKCNF